MHSGKWASESNVNNVALNGTWMGNIASLRHRPFTSPVEEPVVNTHHPLAPSFKRSKTGQAAKAQSLSPHAAAATTGPTPKRLHFPTALEEAEQEALTHGMSTLAMTPSQPGDTAEEDNLPGHSSRLLLAEPPRFLPKTTEVALALLRQKASLYRPKGPDKQL